MSSSSSTKETSIDRFSALPDSILIHILSFLEVNEASITCLLSKRWQFLWTQLPTLVFREGTLRTERMRKFISRVYRTLLIYSRNNLERLEIRFSYNEKYACDVNAWIEFAVRNKVKEFHLLLYTCKSELHTGLPQIMYSNSSLTSLYLLRSVMTPRKTIEWRSLTELKIVDTLLSQDVVEKILSGCPVLRSLYIGECWGFNCFDIKSPSLYTLCVSTQRDSDDEVFLEISAPYVRCLEIDHIGDRKLCLRNLQSLVRADVQLTVPKWIPLSEEVKSSAKELLVNTQQAKELKVGGALFEVMSQLVFNGWLLPQSMRECLRVCVYTGDNYMHVTSGFLALLESSPEIVTLTINLDVSGYCSNLIESGPSTRDDLNCNLKHLKTVIIKYKGKPSDFRDQMFTWARILLKRATILEKMAIKTHLNDKSNFVKISQELLKYARSSPMAVVELHE